MVGLLRLPRRAPIQKTEAGRSAGIHSCASLLFGLGPEIQYHPEGEVQIGLVVLRYCR